MLAVNPRRVGVLALHHLRLAWNRDSEIADVADIFQRNEVLHQHLRLIERLLVRKCLRALTVLK